ncbi:hypothetical protein H4S08_001046 [Coemansia sp. RSA 1365]|nr:hypothetical protein H4S08_001046 [Coemansia sp. RSA 1365]
MNAPESSNGVVTTMFGVGSVIGSSVSGILSDYIGDVYPANLLGFKVAIIYLCNNIGYTIGPVCGQRLFSVGGIKGPALVVIALGLLKFALLVIFAEDSLVIRKKLRTEVIIFQQASSDVAVVEAPGSQELEANKPPDKKSASLSRVSSQQSQDADNNSPNSTHKISILRVLTRPPVLVSTLVIITCIGIQYMLEGIVPLYLVDRLNHTHDDGMTFVVVGLVFTLAAPVIGKASDMIISWQGERMRYYIMLFGAIAIIANVIVVALFKTYTAMMIGYALFAVSNLCMFIPAQSAYGDFVNGSDTNTMARGYSIAVFSWAAGAICLPPIATALYLVAGFAKPAIVITVVTCVISAGACQAYIIWGRNALAHV